MTPELTYREAIAQAIADELASDPDVIFFGEDVGAAGGVFKSTVGLFERFGAERVRDTPISEQAIVGTAIGAAIMGLRPIAEIMFADFAGVCFDQLANQLAKYRYLTGGQASLPVTVRMANGAGAGFAAQHSQPTENWFLNIPGLKIAVPGTVEDCYGLLRAAVRDDNPVLVFEHKNLFGTEGHHRFGSLPPRRGRHRPQRKRRDGRGDPADAPSCGSRQPMRSPARASSSRSSIPRTLVPFDDETVAREPRPNCPPPGRPGGPAERRLGRLAGRLA